MSHSPSDMTQQTQGREVLAKGAKFDFAQVTLRTPDGREITRQYVQHPGAVAIVPVLADPEPSVVLIRNERAAVGRVLWEIPAGTLEPGEDPSACAGRELIEETGYEAGRIDELGWFYTSPGLSDERMFCYVARDLTHIGQQLEADEFISVHATPIPEALAMAEDGRVRDAKSMLALFLAERRGLLRP